MIDLSNSIERQKLARQILADVDAYCIHKFTEEPRNHLGGSVIGDACAAKSWNTFRHLKQEKFNGQKLRLFNRGHKEEARFIEWLVGIGFEVVELNPETGKQFRISGSKGHFGGSLDCCLKPPERYKIDELLLPFGEFKTHNEKNFAKLKKEGVLKSKPIHFRQMCSYGFAYNYRFALYCAVNKNDDELYFEIVELDFKLAEDLFRKADNIIFSQVQPQKIAQTKTFFDCVYCHYSGICHEGEVPEKNCRSCKNAYPVEDAQWQCALNNQIIPQEFIKLGCSSWTRII